MAKQQRNWCQDERQMKLMERKYDLPTKEDSPEEELVDVVGKSEFAHFSKMSILFAVQIFEQNFNVERRT